jgi:hypothetical protein
MTLRDAIKRVSEQFSRNGSFLLLPNESINEVVVRERVSNEYGVYIIFSCDKPECPIYIGKAGTIRTNGTWKEQGLRERLTAVQKKKRRVEFFRGLMRDTYRNGLEFRWFITHDGKDGRLPALAEIELLQAHLDEFGCLPELNEAA